MTMFIQQNDKYRDYSIRHAIDFRCFLWALCYRTDHLIQFTYKLKLWQCPGCELKRTVSQLLTFRISLSRAHICSGWSCILWGIRDEKNQII